MRIDNNTKLKDMSMFINFIDNADEIKAAALKVYGDYSELTISEFIELSELRMEYEDITLYRYYWLLGFKDFVDSFLKAVDNMTVPQSVDERNAAAKCLPVTLAESMLIFTREYFGLHSFEDAGKITLGEYLMARKDAYNTQVFQRSYDNIIMKKSKVK